MDSDHSLQADLPVGDGHVLHVRTYGSARGIPAVYLHGGPGSGCQPAHARLFDAARFRIVLLDQRGAGRSRPKRGLSANTTAHLVADLERVRRYLDIDRWLVVGGSWGSTLALAYAQAFPAQVLGIVLRAVFLGTRRECEWAFRGAAETFRPELWEAFRDLPARTRAGRPGPRLRAPARAPGPADSPAGRRSLGDVRGDPVDDRAAGTEAAGPARPRGRPPTTGRGPNTPYVEWHYIKNDFFLEPDQLLRNAGRLRGIPGRIVQGRYDLLCPPTAAAAIARAWPGSQLTIVPGTGHAGTEPPIRNALTAAVRQLAAEHG